MLQPIQSQITENIKVIVETFYQPDQSNILTNEHFFGYRITIENFSGYTVKLLSRQWHIFDSQGFHRQIQGEGVVGEQPIIEPREFYQYSSACNLNSEMGTMHGTYLMERQADGSRFEVQIPKFVMVVPFRLN